MQPLRAAYISCIWLKVLGKTIPTTDLNTNNHFYLLETADQMKFQTKLYIFFALTVILPICFATVVFALLFSRVSSDEANNRLQNAASVVKAYTQNSNISLTDDLAFKLVNQPSLASALTNRNPAEAIPSLDYIAQQLGAYQVSLYSMDGALLTQAGPADTNNRCLATASIPIMQGGAVKGTVVATREIDKSFLKNILGETGLATAVSCGTETLASTFPESTVVPPSDVAAADPSGIFSTKRKVGGEDYFLSQYSTNTDPLAQPVIFTLGYPANAVEERRTIVLETGASLVAFSVLVAALLAYLVTRSITNPLRLLTKAVLKAEAGDLNSQVNITSRDEIGVLARNFNRMVWQISRFIEQMRQAQQHLLQAFGFAGDLLTSGYDRERLVKSVTDTVAFATTATATAFYLTKEGSDRQSLFPARLSPESFFTDLRIQTITEVIQGIETGAIRGIISRPLDDDYLFLVSPVILQENMFGALVAIVESDHGTAESSCRVLQSLANQAATALENIRLNKVLQEMVITDSLTGLFNIRYFNDMLNNQIENSKRYKHELSLLIIDLDDFKKVNDTYGHPVGDEVLRQVGLLFNENIRKADIAARYGGEEFAIILPHTPKSIAFDVAEKLRMAAQERHVKNYPEITIRFSVGVASFPGDADSPGKLTRVADDATYEAKKQGKNRTVAA